MPTNNEIEEFADAFLTLLKRVRMEKYKEKHDSSKLRRHVMARIRKNSNQL